MYRDDVSSFDGPEIGRRVASYRKLNGWSMGELERRTGGFIKRDVIANIETRRKKDITVRQLVTLAEALAVPPLALLVDLNDMVASSGVEIVDEDGDLRTLTNMGFVRWVAGTMPLEREVDETLPSHVFANEVLTAVHDLAFREDQYLAAVAKYGSLASGSGSKAELEVLQAEVRTFGILRDESRRRLRSLGVRIERDEGGDDQGFKHADAAATVSLKQEDGSTLRLPQALVERLMLGRLIDEHGESADPDGALRDRYWGDGWREHGQAPDAS